MKEAASDQALAKLISEALAIEAEAAQEAGALGFMARAMVQATMPHRRAEGNEFTRRNGAFTLTLLAPSGIGLPYGNVPRLLLAWLTTEAVRTRSRELVLGDSLSAFIRELGMGAASGGPKGTITRLKSQITRLFSSTISCTYEDADRTALVGYRVADRAMLWWSAKRPDQAALWESTVTLTEAFYNEVINRPVPIDMRALRALKSSPLAIDIYTWLTYRMSYLHQPTTIPWAVLAAQFGSDYTRTRAFKAAFLAELVRVQTVYHQAEAESAPAGLILRPSRPHIARKK